MRKVCVVVGTRPEAIKMAPVILELRRHSEEVSTSVVATAQHREMLDDVFETFKLVPDADLDLMVHGQTLHDLTANVILSVSKTLASFGPDIVLVQGDTTTTFVVALASFYLKIPVGHVEAGLRTYDRFHPYPEEINRRLTTVLADWHFAPTPSAKANLLAEGIDSRRIRVTGNTVIDALFAVVRDDFDFSSTPLGSIDKSKKWLLVTAHRRENFGEPLRNICAVLKSIAKGQQIEIIYPVHPNPNVRQTVYEQLGKIQNIHLLPPLSYEVFAQAMNRAFICLTDSGGIQEEAPSLGKPVLVMREVTERPEAVSTGNVRIVGTDHARILKEVSRLFEDEDAYRAMSHQVNPYGDGRAAKRISSVLLKEFGLTEREEPPFA
jgi:UDP-N-acetylglucosamine 2-epimerase (non-hydrolysing)